MWLLLMAMSKYRCGWRQSVSLISYAPCISRKLQATKCSRCYKAQSKSLPLLKLAATQRPNYITALKHLRLPITSNVITTEALYKCHFWYIYVYIYIKWSSYILPIHVTAYIAYIYVTHWSYIYGAGVTFIAFISLQLGSLSKRIWKCSKWSDTCRDAIKICHSCEFPH